MSAPTRRAPASLDIATWELAALRAGADLRDLLGQDRLTAGSWVSELERSILLGADEH